MIVLAGHIASCKKDFTDPVMSRVAFTFDWGALPAGAEIGEGMRLCFYAEDGQVYEMESDTTSFQGLLPVGNYQVLLRNSTAPGIRFRGEERFATAEAYVAPVVRASETVGQPGWLFAAALTGCKVTEKNISGLSVAPKPMVRRISFNVKVTDHKEVESVKGSLLNVATALNLSTGKPVPASIGETDIPIERSADAFTGSVLVFSLFKSKDDVPGKADKDLRLTISYADGSDKTVELNISDQLDDEEDIAGGDVNVDIDVAPNGIRLEVSIIEWVNGKGPDIPVRK